MFKYNIIGSSSAIVLYRLFHFDNSSAANLTKFTKFLHGIQHIPSWFVEYRRNYNIKSALDTWPGNATDNKVEEEEEREADAAKDLRSASATIWFVVGKRV